MKNAKTILITGATAGIGRAAAIALAQEGHRVFATGRREEALEALAKEAGDLDLEVARLDVTDPENIEATRTWIDGLTDGGGIDVLINNAGYGMAGPLASITDEDLRRQFDTNVFGLMAVTRAFVPQMMKKGGGRIINVGSVAGRMTMPFFAAYNATKYAVESLSDGLRIELEPFGVQVALVEPGPIKTEFSDRAMTTVTKYRTSDSPYLPVFDRAAALHRFADGQSDGPEPVVRAIRHAVVARCVRSRYVVPFKSHFILALVALLPTRILDSIWRLGFGLTRRRLNLGVGQSYASR